MRPVVWFVAVLTALPALPWAGAAQVAAPGTQSRIDRRLSLDFGWRFTLGDPAGAEAPSFDDGSWRTVDVPHDWSIEGPYDENAPTGGGGGYLPTGVAWYRRAFTRPDAWVGRSVTLELDGVYQNSDVWINGHHLGHRPNGYVSFAYDLTSWLRSGTNVVAVRVDNSKQPNSRWYSGSGIYRHVWLTVTDRLHVDTWGTYVTTPEVDAASAEVEVTTTLVNEAMSARGGRLRLTITDPSGQAVATAETTFDVTASSYTEVTQRLGVSGPALWTLDTPALYTLITEVADPGGSVVDGTRTVFGIRTATFDADRGFLLNGEPVKMLGVNLHHGGGPVGAAVPEAVWKRRLDLLKGMGVNAIRTAHNPPAPEFLALCDSLGLLVMDEAFDEWTHGKVPHGYHEYFDEWGERDLVDFIRRDRNHASVVLWSLGNEIGEQHAEGGEEVLRMLRDVARREDPTRPVTAGNDHIAADDGATTEGFMRLLDVVGYNYVDRWHERRELYAWPDKLAHPRWSRVGTESVSVRGTRGEYSLGDDPDRVQPSYTTGMIRAERLWRFVATNDWFSGDFMWTGIDYLGEARWPRKSSTSGVLDLVGFPDDGYFFYKSRWTDAPMIHLLPHWSWPGREGQSIPVLAYTNCDAVELYLNGRSLGEKRIEFPMQGTSESWNHYDRPPIFPTTDDLHLSWDVPYEPGVLRAVGRRNGEVVAAEEIRTASEPVALRLSLDRSTIRSGVRDVAHVTVEVVDANGTVVPDASPMLEVSASGPARVLAVGNGDPTDHTSYGIPRRAAFHGMALAMIQSSDRPGPVTVTVRAEGLPEATVSLDVAPGGGPPRVPIP